VAGSCDDLYALLVDDSAGLEQDGGGLVRVCGSGGQSQFTHVYTSTSSTLKVVVHRVDTAADNDHPDTSYNFLIKYEGPSNERQRSSLLCTHNFLSPQVVAKIVHDQNGRKEKSKRKLN